VPNFFAPDSVHVARPDAFFIDGKWAQPTSDRILEVISPSTEEIVARVPEASAADIDRAVAAARRAFDEGPWPRTSPAERAAVLRRFAAEIRVRKDDFVQAFVHQVGAPVMFGASAVETPALIFEENARLIEELPFEIVRPREDGVSIIVREPVGVVGAIAPWNTPLMLAAVKVAMAMATGSTIVVKPAPETPLDMLILAECALAAGVPPGVFNVIQAGREVGELLVRHPGVDKVAFTGSTAAGKRIAAICAERVARVSLELGGKSPAVVMEDMNPEDVAPSMVPAIAFLSGQVCAALSRLFVPRRRQAEYADALVAGFRQLKIGDPFDPSVFMGPITLGRQLDRVNGYVARGVAEGAKIATGGKRPGHLNRGFYIEPTLFTDVTNDMTIAQEEIFGPVLSLIPYDDEEDAIRQANDSPFGLNAAIYTKDTDRAYAYSRRLRAGNVTQNGWVYDHRSPFGGFKQSGLGRESGPEGLDGYYEYKTIYLPKAPTHLT